MKKLKDKTIIVICSICMMLICCFGVSYKLAHKTYAEDLTPITQKQRLGAFLCSLAFSAGVRFYITTVGMYEWLVDNFNYVMLSLQLNKAANDVYQNALDNFDNENKTYTLDPEFTDAVQQYLKYLQSQGINQYSGQVEIGKYTENNANYYTGTSSSNKIYVENDGPTKYVWADNPKVRIAFFRNGNRLMIGAASDIANCKVYYQIGSNSPNVTNLTSYNGYYIANVSNRVGVDFNKVYVNYNSINTTSINNQTILYYTYGEGAGTSTTIPFTGKPNSYWTETEMTLDRPSKYTVDYSETDGAEETSTLEELIELVNELIETGTQTQQETIPQVEVKIITPTIDPTTVDIPTLFDGIPEIITPECVGLGSCLVSGVQTASQHLQNIYESNSNVANYTMVSLAIGIALYILTGGI